MDIEPNDPPSYREIEAKAVEKFRRVQKFANFPIIAFRKFLRLIATMSVDNSWLWTYNGWFVVSSSNDGRAQLLRFVGGMENPDRFEVTIGSDEEIYLEGMDVTPLAALETRHDTIFVVSSEDYIFHCDWERRQNMKIEFDSCVIGVEVNDEGDLTFNPKRLYTGN